MHVQRTCSDALSLMKEDKYGLDFRIVRRESLERIRTMGNAFIIFISRMVGSIALEVDCDRASVSNWSPLKGIEFGIAFDLGI